MASPGRASNSYEDEDEEWEDEWDEQELEDDDEWEEDGEEEDEWDEEPPERSARSRAALAPVGLRRGVALGWLAMTPLILAYEWSVASLADGRRNAAEVLLFRWLEPLGGAAPGTRRLLLVGLTLAALVYCLRHHWTLGPSISRILLEGAVAALVLGPALVMLQRMLAPGLGSVSFAGPPAEAPRMAQALFVAGAGAFEEIVFRVGLYGALYLVTRKLCELFGIRWGITRVVAEVSGLLGSSLLFAAFHLRSVLTFLGSGGEVFEPSLFAYRVLAGVLLGGLFRLRGPGVAAWAHALFNTLLLLGAGPPVTP